MNEQSSKCTQCGRNLERSEPEGPNLVRLQDAVSSKVSEATQMQPGSPACGALPTNPGRATQASNGNESIDALVGLDICFQFAGSCLKLV